MHFNFGVIKEVINLLIANSYDACKNIICADGQIARCPLKKMYWWGQLQERLSCRLCCDVDICYELRTHDLKTRHC